MIIALVYTVFIGAFFLILPQLVLLLTTTDRNVIDTAIPALRVAAVGQIFYAIGVVLANGLQAVGKTMYVMLAEVLVNWFIFVPLAYFMGVYLEFGLIGAWWALPFYVIIFALLIYAKFMRGDWTKYKNV